MAIFLGLCAASSSQAAELEALRSITVSGQAERQVVPDEAHVQVNLNALEPKLADAKTAHDKKLKQLLAIVSKAGIDEKKVKTLYATSEPQYDYTNSQRVFKGYRVQTQLYIAVNPTDKLAGLMDTITEAGFERGASTEWGNLLSVSYQVSNPDKLRDELLADAIVNARAKAENMANAAGVGVGAVMQINETGAPSFNFPRAMPMMAMRAALADAAPIAPPAGEQKMQASVTVTFALK